MEYEKLASTMLTCI